MRCRIDQQVLRLDVPVADTHGVDVCQCPEGLVGIKLDEEVGHWLLHLVVMLEHSVDCLRNVVHHDVQVDLIFLRGSGGVSLG